MIFLTVHDDPDYLSEAMALGAMAYVVKNRLVSDLPQAIHDVSAGRRFVSASPKLQRSGSEATPCTVTMVRGKGRVPPGCTDGKTMEATGSVYDAGFLLMNVTSARCY